MKVLQICHKKPFPITDGGTWSLYHSAMGLLENRIELSVLAIDTPRFKVDISTMPNEYSKQVKFFEAIVDTRFKPFSAFLNLFQSTSYFYTRFYSEEFKIKLIEILQNQRPDYIQLEHVYLCIYLPTIKKYSKAKIILRPQNVESQVWQRVIEKSPFSIKNIYLKLQTKRLKAFETSVLDMLDGIMALSEQDEQFFQNHSSKPNLCNIPLGTVPTEIPTSNYNKKALVFYHIGSMDWTPNQQAMDWFIHDIIPKITQQHPGFIFRMAGKAFPKSYIQLQNKNLIVDGTVPDSRAYHLENDIMVVPLLSGGGIRVKIIEAMSLGKVVISTTIGAEGIPYTNKKNILIADTVEEFVDQINNCIQNPSICSEISKHAKIFADENYNRKFLGERMINFFETL